MINPEAAPGRKSELGSANIAEIMSENLCFIHLARSLTALANYVGAAQYCASNLPRPRDDLLIEFLDKAVRECEEARRCVHEAYSPGVCENNSHCSASEHLNPAAAGDCVSCA